MGSGDVARIRRRQALAADRPAWQTPPATATNERAFYCEHIQLCRAVERVELQRKANGETQEVSWSEECQGAKEQTLYLLSFTFDFRFSSSV